MAEEAVAANVELEIVWHQCSSLLLSLSTGIDISKGLRLCGLDPASVALGPYVDNSWSTEISVHLTTLEGLLGSGQTFDVKAFFCHILTEWIQPSLQGQLTISSPHSLRTN